jgi:hypothetical protein
MYQLSVWQNYRKLGLKQLSYKILFLLRGVNMGESFELDNIKEVEELYLYQSDIYYLERITVDSIHIHTNDGRIIEIKGDFKIFEVQS